MNAKEARRELLKPLEFGNRRQIEANKLLCEIGELMEAIIEDDDLGMDYETQWRTMSMDERRSAVQSFGALHGYPDVLIRETCRDIENW